MSEISAKQVKELRDLTGAGMMDSKAALLESQGDIDAAMEILTRKGITKSAERSSREVSDGSIAIALSKDNTACALVYLGSETDFSAKAEDFVDLTQRMADAVLEGGEAGLDFVNASFEDEINQIRITKKENIEIKKVELVQAAPNNTLDVYLHTQDGRGVNAVVVEGAGVDKEALHQVSLHVAFARPTFLSREEMPKDEIDAQRQLFTERSIEEGKPQAALEKIVEGKVTGWLKERVLLEQGLHGEKTKVEDTLDGGSIVRFVQACIR